MHRRTTHVLAAWLLAGLCLQPITARGQHAPPASLPDTTDVLPEPRPPEPSLTTWLTDPEILAEGAGALLGFVAFNFYVAPIAAAAGPGSTALQAWLGTRVVASTLAATGAVIATSSYDIWAGRPINYSYFWSRGGAVAGVAAGSAVLGMLGYPSSATLTRFSVAWAANRTFLVGTALLGDWIATNWARDVKLNEPEYRPR